MIKKHSYRTFYIHWAYFLKYTKKNKKTVHKKAICKKKSDAQLSSIWSFWRDSTRLFKLYSILTWIELFIESLKDFEFLKKIKNFFQQISNIIKRKTPPNRFKKVQLRWLTVNGFGSYKTAGEDGIFPGLLQQGIETLVLPLCKILTACLAFGYVPKAWKKVRVILIPKSGRSSYELAKSCFCRYQGS
jgi:hypothetical protein